MPVIDFIIDVAEPVRQTAEALGDDLQDCLRDYAPSIICSKIEGDAVTIKVAPGDELWTTEFEQLLRDEVAGHRGATGTPCRLVVIKG